MGLIINPRQIIKDGITSLRDVWSSSKVSAELSGKQATLVSGTNIKTINNTSLLGSGDITISGGGDIPKINMTATTATLDPNKFYVWGEVASLDISLAAETADIENVYKFQFQSGATATTLTLPNTIKWFGETPVSPKTRYIISIQSDIAKIERSWRQSRLPIDYQEVEYLESDGSAYLQISANTNIDTADITDLSVTFKDITTDASVCGHWLDNMGQGFTVGRLSTNIRWWIGSVVKIHPYNDYSSKTSVVYSDNTFSLNGTVMDSSYTPSSYIISTFRLFGHSGYGATVIHCRIYEFSLTATNFSTFLIPCYRKSDNEAGMYNIVNDVFYPNAGTGTFIVGPDV